MNREAVAREMLAIARELTASKKLKCVSGGRVEVVVGEARSADAKPGDVFSITREDRLRYHGTLDIHGSGFRHDPGLSGRPTRPGVFAPDQMEFAVLKENVGEDADGSNGFWATWIFA